MSEMAKIQELRKQLEARIREIKPELRSTWTRDMWKEQMELHSLRRRATGVYVALAWLHGKIHLQSIPEQHMSSWFGYRWRNIEYTPETLCEDLAKIVLDNVREDS